MKRKMKNLICLLMTVLFVLTGCGSAAEDTAVLKIDGQEIMRSEYMVYLYTTTKGFVTMAGEDVWNMDFDGQTADELVEERTISTIRSVLAAKKYAEENGIALTEEQKTAAAQAAEQFLASTPEADLTKMGVDAKKLQQMMEDSYLYTLVYQEIAAECDVDDGDLEQYYLENKEQLRKGYTALTMLSILAEDAETAAEVVEKAENGEDFLALFDTYDVDPYGENGGEMKLPWNYLQTTFGLQDELTVGDVVGPIGMGDGWFVLKVTAKEIPDDAEVKEIAADLYRSEIQTAYTDTRFGELMEEQSVEKIDGVWDTLEKFH